jgi:hypothetical protein
LLYLECHTQVAEGTYRFDFATCHLCPVAKEAHQRCDIFSRHVAENVGAYLPDDAFVIPSMGILITNHCNLTCEGCNHLRDHYQPSDNVRLETEAIIGDIQRVLDAADFVERVVVVGGEAFVHSDIANILRRVLALPKIGLVQIITNGTIVPKEAGLLELLTDRRILVEISGYGDYLPRPLRENVRQFVSLLRSRGVNHRHLETLDWQDFGGFEHRGYTRQQHLRVYKTCCFVSNDLFDGKLFKCSRSAFGTRIGKIPDYPADYVDVRNSPPDQLRPRLLEFFAHKFPEVCQHCDGTSEKRVPAGVQLVKPRRQGNQLPLAKIESP